jgi:predicted nucleotidyltransferase
MSSVSAEPQSADVAAAVGVVTQRLPGALVALLAGSAARGDSTLTSDLDIVVVLDGPPAPYRETVVAGGRPVELFVHTVDSLEYWYGVDAADRRNTLADMVAHGVVLIDGEVREQLQSRAADLLSAGPVELGHVELDGRRYALTDMLDDLTGATDNAERDVVAGQVFVAAAELALLSRRQWMGRGKWLLRRLQQMDRTLAERLVEAHRTVICRGDPWPLVEVTDGILATVGGRLSSGYRADGFPDE